MDLGWMAAYPGNEWVLERLREVVGSGEAIAFVGAGASAGLYPLWHQLITELVDGAVTRGDATAEDRGYWLRDAVAHPQRVVRGIRERLSPRVFEAILREIFGPRAGPDGNRFTPSHGVLLGLPFRGYVTTNYDRG